MHFLAIEDYDTDYSTSPMLIYAFAADATAMIYLYYFRDIKMQQKATSITLFLLHFMPEKHVTF